MRFRCKLSALLDNPLAEHSVEHRFVSKGDRVPSAKQRLLLLSSALVILAFQVGVYLAMQRFQTRKPDFAHLYEAGRKLNQERFPKLFSWFPGLDSDSHKVWLNDHEEYPPDNLHPPYEMVIYAALALFDFHVAYLIWWACNLSFLFVSAYLVWPYVPSLHNSYPYLLILMATFFPILVALVQGQNSLMLLLVLAITFCLLKEGRDFRAGFMLGLGMFKFILVAPMVFWVLLEKRWKSLAGFCAGCMVLFIIALGLVGLRGIESYVLLLVGFGKKSPEEPGTQAIMPNLRGLLYASGGRVTSESILTVVTLLFSLALLVWVNAKLKHYNSRTLLYALQVLLITAISYHFYPHDGAVLVLPILLLLNHALEIQDQRKIKISILSCSACAYLAPFIGGMYVGMPMIGLSSLVLLVITRSEALKLPIAQSLHVHSNSLNLAS